MCQQSYADSNLLYRRLQSSNSSSTSSSTTSSSSSTPLSSANMNMNSSSQSDVLFKPTFFKTEANPDDEHPPKIKEEICDDRDYSHSQSILHSHLTAKREYCSAAPIVQQQQKMFKKSQSIINRFNNNGEDDLTMTTAMYRVNNGCIRSKKATETSTTKTAENFVVFKTTLPDD
ncbi:hypothetical protein ACFFRR_002782 [Megaselia abdita]